MNTSLRTQLDHLDNRLADLLARLEAYDHEQLNQRPAPGKWSALMVIHHLMIAEEAALRYLQKKLSFKPELRKAGIGERLRSYTLVFFLNSPFKFKAPAGAGDSALPADSNLKETAEKWLALRRETRAFLDALPVEYEDKAVYRHPVGGLLSLDGMLRFFLDHFNRHRGQIERTLASVQR